MKRVCALISVILLLLGFTSFSRVKADVTGSTSKLMNDAPQIFSAYGFQYNETGEETPPFHKLQAQMEFHFMENKTVSYIHQVNYTDESIYGPSSHIIDFDLSYDIDLLEEGFPFISGTFTYNWEHGGEVTEYSGIVSGSLVEISTEIMDFVSEYEYTNALALDLEVNGNAWDWVIYMEVPGEEQYYLGNIIGTPSGAESDSDLPEPSTQADVAAGVGVSAVGIAVANALTKTTVLGSVSLTPPLNIPADAALNTNLVQPATESGSGFFRSLLRFFKSIFESFRDMVTDEGRSFASGKLSESLGDSGIDIAMDDTGDSGGDGGD